MYWSLGLKLTDTQKKIYKGQLSRLEPRGETSRRSFSKNNVKFDICSEPILQHSFQILTGKWFAGIYLDFCTRYLYSPLEAVSSGEGVISEHAAISPMTQNVSIKKRRVFLIFRNTPDQSKKKKETAS